MNYASTKHVKFFYNDYLGSLYHHLQHSKSSGYVLCKRRL